jgi:hypothetical protein
MMFGRKVPDDSFGGWVFNRYRRADMVAHGREADVLIDQVQATGLGLIEAFRYARTREAVHGVGDLDAALEAVRSHQLLQRCIAFGLRHHGEPNLDDDLVEYDLDAALTALSVASRAMLTTLGVGGQAGPDTTRVPEHGLPAYRNLCFGPTTVWRQWKRQLRL